MRQSTGFGPRHFKAVSRNSTLPTPAFQTESGAPSNSHVTHLSYIQNTQSAHTVNHSGTMGPLAFALPTKKFHTFTHVPFPRKSSTKKRFPWPGQEVSPEIDVSRHCQLCAIATSFFQACGETWSSQTGIPRGWDHFRPMPQRVTTALEFREKTFRLPRADRGDSKGFASPSSL